VTGAEFEGVDIDLLADYVGGALDGTPDEERVAALVATDDAWRAAHEALEPGMIAVGAVLREFEPEPMPDDLAARLDTMFRAAASEEAAPEAVPAKVVDLDRARRRRRWVAPIGVAAAVVAFAGFGVNSLLAPGAEDTAARSANSEAAPMAAAPAAGREVSRSGTDYTASTLTSVGQQLRNAPSSADEPQTASGTELQEASGLDRLTMPDAVAACLQEITRVNGGGVISVEFLDYARFNGDPALIVRFSAADGIWVWAVGPECGTPGAGADELERVPVR
jgi:hypothetical protein